jgi:hypothetical protein
MHNSAERFQFEILTSYMESAAFAVRPLVAELSSWLRVIDADRHAPAFRAEQPFLNQLRIGVRAIQRFRRRSKAPRHNHMRIAFRLQRHLAHRISPFF